MPCVFVGWLKDNAGKAIMCRVVDFVGIVLVV